MSIRDDSSYLHKHGQGKAQAMEACYCLRSEAQDHSQSNIPSHHRL